MTKQRVMIVSRLFTGLADGLAGGVWQPKGVPAAYKLFEALAADPEVELLTVFAAKEASEGRFSKARRFTMSPLGQVVILPWAARPWLARLRLDGKLREISHLLRCLWLWARFRPDVAYFTNATFPVAAVFARLGLCRVILRLLGLHPDQWKYAARPGGMIHWCYRSPFDRVICTLDGSGIDYYLPKLIAPDVPRSVWLNGVDPLEADDHAFGRILDAYPAGGSPLVLFVGRLEWNKGCREFVAGILQALKDRPDGCQAVLLGEGGLRDELEGKIAEAGAEKNIHLVGGVSHGEVAAWMRRADIYVSLNWFGNLSNANLEALSAGKCMVILGEDAERHIDVETTRLIPQDAVLRIGREDVVGNLGRALNSLLLSPQSIADFEMAASALGGSLLESWEKRIAREKEVICP